MWYGPADWFGHWIAKLRFRPDKDARFGTFMLQRHWAAWLRHRMRLFNYALATWSIHLAVMHIQQTLYPGHDGRSMYSAIRSILYNDFMKPGIGEKPFWFWNVWPTGWTRYTPTLTYSHGQHANVFPAKLDDALKTAAERDFEAKTLVKELSTGHEQTEWITKARWVQNMNAEYLPVGHDPKQNEEMFVKLCRGVEQTFKGHRVEAMAEFAAIENARHKALDQGKPSSAADGLKNLRFAYKATALHNYSTSKRAWLHNIQRFWEFGRGWSRFTNNAPSWLFLHWVVWMGVISVAAAPFEDWKLKKNLDMLACWGPADDESSFEERKAKWARQLEEEARAGTFCYRSSGTPIGWTWFNKMPVFRPSDKWN